MTIEFEFSVKGGNLLALQKAGMEGIRSLLDLAADAAVLMPSDSRDARASAPYAWSVTAIRGDVSMSNAEGTRVVLWTATIRGEIR